MFVAVIQAVVQYSNATTVYVSKRLKSNNNSFHAYYVCEIVRVYGWVRVVMCTTSSWYIRQMTSVAQVPVTICLVLLCNNIRSMHINCGFSLVSKRNSQQWWIGLMADDVRVHWDRMQTIASLYIHSHVRVCVLPCFPSSDLTRLRRRRRCYYTQQ